ncbi:MAG: hypothetical protein V1760_03510 [Candidatus Peregrinibacteria bacterium]
MANADQLRLPEEMSDSSSDRARIFATLEREEETEIVNPKRYPVGFMVQAPRTKGGTSKAVILEHVAKGQVIVGFPDDDSDAIPNKPIRCEQLDKFNPKGATPPETEREPHLQLKEGDRVYATVKGQMLFGAVVKVIPGGHYVLIKGHGNYYRWFKTEKLQKIKEA